MSYVWCRSFEKRGHLFKKCKLLTCAEYQCEGYQWALAEDGADPTGHQTRKHDSCRNISGNCKYQKPKPLHYSPWPLSCYLWWTLAHTRPDCRWKGSCWPTQWTLQIGPPASASATPTPLCSVLCRWLLAWHDPEWKTYKRRLWKDKRLRTDTGSRRPWATFWRVHRNHSLSSQCRLLTTIFLFAEN